MHGICSIFHIFKRNPTLFVKKQFVAINWGRVFSQILHIVALKAEVRFFIDCCANYTDKGVMLDYF